MPARKKPVKNLKMSKLMRSFDFQKIPRLHIAPKTALIKNTFEGENRSEIVKMAKVKVPLINPNCTAEVRCPNALWFR